VTHGKPSPDMFLLAARQMGVAPADCLVFEDAEPGIRAAEAAGMRWVRVPSRPATPTSPSTFAQGAGAPNAERR
jgi:beta-phosphoglucomutase-like phosphatase (HAD superfamily)